MELRHMRYFLVLAEELNFSRAAEKLHMSQPPLSRQIKELEEEIGAKLFHRTKRTVELTNAGKVFLESVYQILAQVEQARISTRLSSTGKEGEFRIGFTGAVQDLTPTIKEYQKRFPEVGIILNHLTSMQQVEGLNDNSIDIGLISTPVNDPNIEARPIKEMHFVAALPENHHLASKKSIYLADMVDENFIMTSKYSGTLYYGNFMNLFKNTGFTPNITIQCHDLQTALALVAAGMGVTITASPTGAINGIIKRKIEDVDHSIIGLLAWRKDNQSEILNQFLTLFFDELLEVVQSDDPHITFDE